MILITGAAGKTGQAVMRALSARGQSVRAVVRRPEQEQAVRDCGAHDVVDGDLRDTVLLKRALHDVRAIYHICPNVSPDEVTIGQAAITAARAAGVEHFVYHSVLHPQTEAMPHHWLKARVEEQLFESGLPYTILQPTAYMQNVLAQRDTVVRYGIYPVSYPIETRLGMVDLADVAEAAATVLAEPGHVGATYELAGPDVLTQTEIAAALSRQLGRPVRAEALDLGDWELGARSAGMGEYQVTTLLQMFRYYAQHGFWGNPNVLGWLLHRPATTFEAFISRTMHKPNTQSLIPNHKETSAQHETSSLSVLRPNQPR